MSPRYVAVEMRRRAVIGVAALLVSSCGATHAMPTRTSTLAARSRVLTGCYSLPFSGGSAELLPVDAYHVEATPDRICFRLLRSGAKCSAAATPARSYGDPIVDTDEPRSGTYAVVYYRSEHRWFLAGPGCSSS